MRVKVLVIKMVARERKRRRTGMNGAEESQWKHGKRAAGFRKQKFSVAFFHTVYVCYMQMFLLPAADSRLSTLCDLKWNNDSDVKVPPFSFNLRLFTSIMGVNIWLSSPTVPQFFAQCSRVRILNQTKHSAGHMVTGPNWSRDLSPSLCFTWPDGSPETSHAWNWLKYRPGKSLNHTTMVSTMGQSRTWRSICSRLCLSSRTVWKIYSSPLFSPLSKT